MALREQILSCYDVVSVLDDVSRQTLTSNQQYYVLGGIATSAIIHPDTVFDHQTERVIPTQAASQPLKRENGTLRDIDILVLDTLDKDTAKSIKNSISEAIGKSLIVSVFGINEHQPTDSGHRIYQSLSTWTSKRTIDTENQHYYELYPLIQKVPKESYRPWKLELPNGSDIAVFNPAAHLLAYYVRSITSVRSKDLEKVITMKNIIENNPVFKEQIEEGAFSSWKQFANDIKLMLTTDDEFIASQYPDISKTELNIYRQKVKILNFLESNERMVRYAQKGLIQKVLAPIIGSS